jgi:hypothetical protein
VHFSPFVSSEVLQITKFPNVLFSYVQQRVGISFLMYSGALACKKKKGKQDESFFDEKFQFSFHI